MHERAKDTMKTKLEVYILDFYQPLFVHKVEILEAAVTLV